MPTIQNIAEHDFHLPKFPDMSRKIGESEAEHLARVKSITERKDEESIEAYEARMGETSILIPKVRKEKGEPGKPDYQAGGPGEAFVSDEDLAYMRGHRIARRWFGVNVKKGQGLIVADEYEAPEETERPVAKGAKATKGGKAA